MFVIQGHYGNGWEDLVEEETLSEARNAYIDYLINDPEHAHRIEVRGTEGSAAS